jgi:DNA-binding GntR family transcriptional regulator
MDTAASPPDVASEPEATDELRTALIHDRLREAILQGDFDANVPISQVQLAKRLGVSRTPLREALRMLQREGLIHSEPNRRVRVTALSVTDLEQLYATRIVVEALALRLSVPHFNAQDLAEIEARLTEMAEVAQARDPDRWESPHRSYHELLRQHAGTRLIRIARELSDHSERYRRVYLSEPRAWSSAIEEHEAIFEACRAGDAPLAGERIARHLARTALTVIAGVAPEHDPAPVRTSLQMVTPLQT